MKSFTLISVAVFAMALTLGACGKSDSGGSSGVASTNQGQYYPSGYYNGNYGFPCNGCGSGTYGQVPSGPQTYQTGSLSGDAVPILEDGSNRPSVFAYLTWISYSYGYSSYISGITMPVKNGTIVHVNSVKWGYGVNVTNGVESKYMGPGDSYTFNSSGVFAFGVRNADRSAFTFNHGGFSAEFQITY